MVAHEQLQERGLAAAGGADDGETAARRDAQVDIPEHRLALGVGEAEVFYRDALFQLGRDVLALCLTVLGHESGELVHELHRRFAVGEDGRHGGNGRNDEVHELQKGHSDACADCIAVCSEQRGGNEHAELGEEARAACEHVDEAVRLAALVLRVLETAGDALEHLTHAGFGLEALDDGKAGKALLDSLDVALVLFRYGLFAFRELAAAD